ncbi:FusB/FusC family EF-G-binding protein [Rummeliibacillus sp. JY-2-4R]
MERQTIQPFLSVANYHLIEQQMNKIINAFTTTKDRNVILAVKGLAETEIEQNIQPSDDQLDIISQLYSITDHVQGDLYLESLKPYVIPFKEVTESNLKNLFKKEKKLKLPNLESIDLQHTCYLTWDDISTHRKYVVFEQQGKLKSIKGQIDANSIKGICAVCNHHSNVSLFTTTKKGKTMDTFTKHSNYICTDGQSCNRNVTDHMRVSDFFERVTQ